MMIKNYILKDQAGNVVCCKIKEAKKISERMLGLMFAEKMPECDGLLIAPCNSIHTFFMLFPIDVLFLDREFKVVHAIYNLSPWRITWMYWRAHQVLEMKAGTMKKDIKPGERLEAICIN